MDYKITITEIRPPQKAEAKYEDEVEIYTQRTSRPIHLKAIIDAFNISNPPTR